MEVLLEDLDLGIIYLIGNINMSNRKIRYILLLSSKIPIHVSCRGDADLLI
jgi:predicted transcriptional regulator